MQSQVFTLRNASGLHARPATAFVQLAAGLTSAITIENLDRPGVVADGKSIIEVLTLGAGPGNRIRIGVTGPNEDADLAAIAAAVESGLGESGEQRG